MVVRKTVIAGAVMLRGARHKDSPRRWTGFSSALLLCVRWRSLMGSNLILHREPSCSNAQIPQ